jgi:demethylspheroidene O-methyltransferase
VVAEPGRGAAPVQTFADRLYGWRDRLLMSPRFHRWASRFPLTRPVARRRTRALFDLCAGFVYAQVLAACVQLRVFEILAEGPQTTAALATRLSLSPDAAGRLLGAAVALGLLERRGQDRYGLGILGAAVLGNPGVSAMVAHHSMLYADLADPVALLRRGRGGAALAGFWPYASAPNDASGTDDVAPYTGLMAASQPLVADEILDAYPLTRHRSLLDIGGGDGTFLCLAARRAPDLKLAAFDLPPVADLARARFAREGLSGRATAHGGDFLRDPLPSGSDIVSLVRILHDHDDEPVVAILRAARAALPAGGTLLVAEPLAGTAGAEPMGDAYFSFYLMAMGSGRPRRASELGDLLRAAGFAHVQQVRTRNPLLTGVIVAKAV